VTCGAGVRLKTVAQEARRAGVSGLEFLEGIPGSVGGALRMNAGAMGSWTFDAVERVRAMDRDGGVVELERDKIEVRYRACPFFEGHIALAATFRGRRASREAIEQQSRRFNEKRWSTQPAAASAGCIFKNPEGIPAGQLIDELGLKGRRVGGAAVSDVHANFIVNEGQATASDVLRLIDEIRMEAKRQRGIELETEVEIVGESAMGGD
jgi:UDP-N-acetylenolpyruvoylglucosamine reductase